MDGLDETEPGAAPSGWRGRVFVAGLDGGGVDELALLLKSDAKGFERTRVGTGDE